MAAPSFKSTWRTEVKDAPHYPPDTNQEGLGLLVQAVCEQVGDPNIRGHTWFVTTFGKSSFRVEKRIEPSPETLRLMCRTPAGENNEARLSGHYLMAMDFIWDEEQVVRTVKYFVPRQAVDETLCAASKECSACGSG